MLRALPSSTTAQPVQVTVRPFLNCHRCRPANENHIRWFSVHCSAYASRLQQDLVPDLTAEAVAADVLPELHVQLAGQLDVVDQFVDEEESTHFTSHIALQAYPCNSSSSVGAASTAAGWTVSEDTDIAAAAADVPPYSWHQQKFKQQHGRQQQQLLNREQQQGHLRWNAGRSAHPSVQEPQLTGGARSPVVAAGHEPFGTPAPAVAAIAAGLDCDPEQHEGGFISSRAAALQQLKQQQLQVQREHVLARSKQQLYRYSVTDDGSNIQQQHRPGCIHPLKQKTFPLARQQPQGVQGDQATVFNNSSSSSSSSNSSSSTGSSAGIDTGLQPAVSPVRQPQQQQPQQHQQQQPLVPNTPQDPTRGVCLAVFPYCCSRNEVLSLTWQMGLSPAALRFVTRVADADVVLHVKPAKKQRHYQYEEFRAQAADKGIPFVDLKSLSLQELQLYLLPVFRLYAGELSPRDMLLRRRRRGHNKRYTSIKLPPVRS